MKKALLVLLLLLLVAWLLWRWWKSDATDDRGDLAFDRVWLDHEPRSIDDKFVMFFAQTEHPIGGFVGGTFWRGGWDMFRYRAAGKGKLDVAYPANGDRERIAYRAWQCRDGGFDYCLEIGGSSRGPRRYFSRKGWEIRPGDEAAAALRGIAGALPAAQ